VISVGNVTTGGTGKTPMVAWVVARLKERQRDPAILSRGYKAVRGRSDEVELLTNLTGAAVVVEADRVKGAKQAIGQGADVLVLDDGFQHLRLHRDLDIVLLDATNPFGYGHVLPRGLLREPRSALRDADAVVITHCRSVDEERLVRLGEQVRRLAPNATLHQAIHRPIAAIDHHGSLLQLDALAGRRVGAFCGIANPEPFFDDLRAQGAELLWRRCFDDHVDYGRREVLEELRSAPPGEAELLLTTQKDAVKLRDVDLGRPLWQLAIEIDFLSGEEELTAMLDGCLGRVASPERDG